MTHAAFKKILAQALFLLLATLTILLLMNLLTNQRAQDQKQAAMKNTLGVVLPAERYVPISLDSFNERHPTIEAFYAAYDSEGEALGYVIDVKEETETGEILTRMSVSPDGGTLMALRVIAKGEGDKEHEQVRSAEFSSQFDGIRMPAALLTDLPEQDLTSQEYPPISGLTDGTFREQLEKEDEAGYKDFVEIVVKDGRITQVVWDAIQTDGGLNRAKASVSGAYVLADNKVIWAVQAFAMQNKLVEVQDPAKIAIKSDGTTEVVPEVTVNVNAFVMLANKCIEDSKNGLAVSVTPPASMSSVTPAESTSSGDNPDSTLAAGSATTAAHTPANSIPDREKETVGFNSGSEDGVVLNDMGSMMSDLIDGFPASAIKTKINEAKGAQQYSRIVVSTVNQAYLFILDYLKEGE